MKVVTGNGPCDEESPQNRRNIAFVFLGGRQHLQETELMRFKREASCGQMLARRACQRSIKNSHTSRGKGLCKRDETDIWFLILYTLLLALFV